ncbi:SPFH domain-containing protein [Janthinobacterium sp.]|uniref:SPFH domain-containing protein n=1 Tax=Janthinobacterium sp. TaxID=1871054 RepID=UPI0026314A7A|nr:SPFH domain-containing protein [Janthinobacterium sp.]
MKKILLAMMAVVAITGCTRIPEGSIGYRTNFDTTVEDKYLPMGSINQTIIGDAGILPVREIAADIKGMQPQVSGNTTMKTVDLTVTYSINPEMAITLLKKKSAGFHGVDSDKRTLLMYDYIALIAKNATFKVVRDYEPLLINDARAEIEVKIAAMMRETLAKDKLDTAIIISQVLARDLIPSDAVKTSSEALVRAQNEKIRKQVELDTAKLEAERISTLNANPQAIPYMLAQAQVTTANAIAAGKVNTIIVPHNFTSLGNNVAK